MNIQGVLSRLDDVKGSGTQYSARCPAHEDKHSSLSVSVGEDNRILLNCHAGCSVDAITRAIGLSVKDLFHEEKPQQASRPGVIATYDYRDANGNLLAQKLRRSDKSFSWRRPDGNGGWIYNRQGVSHTLYRAGELSGSVFVCEGEKDVDNLHKLGFSAVSGEDGAGNKKWCNEYTEQLRGLHIGIFQDNDKVGKEYAQEVAKALYCVAGSVRVFDISTVWAEIPEHGDISDLIDRFGVEKSGDLIAKLVTETPEWKPVNKEDSLISCFHTLNDFAEEEATWLVPGWIPESQLTLLAADGGIGKTTMWCNIIAAISNGTSCVLDAPGYTRQPMKVAFMTTEDSVRKKLRQKLRLAGANLRNIITPDFLADKEGILRGLKFGSSEMEKVIRYFKPALCVFDPVQGFVPPDINMGSRNAMRDCMAPLISLGEECGTTFIVVCHTNKRKGAYGRDRIADSADLWDISRSVLMAGYTEDQGVRYLSQEKSNYGILQETILFTINKDGAINKTGTTWKRDREYTQDATVAKSAPKREDCKEFIMQTLEECGSMPSKELEDRAKDYGYAYETFKRARGDLKKDGKLEFFSTGSAKSKNRTWHTKLASFPGFVELPEDTQVPFEQ